MPVRQKTDVGLARAIKKLREQLNLSQTELALRAGLHRTYISDVERGTRNISISVLAQIAEAMEMPAWQLLKIAENGTEENSN